MIYLDEALSVIKRAIRSLVDKTTARLLKEIILVDDHSSNGRSEMVTYVHRWLETFFLCAEDLGKKLDEYIGSIHEERPVLGRKVRHVEQLGLTQARLSGWKAAVGDVVAILDAHIEDHVQSRYPASKSDLKPTNSAQR